MRKFLNSWLLVGVFLSALFSYAAVAGTVVRPYGASDYAGGTRAVGSKINTEFDTIVNWLNGGNISSNNLAYLGIANSNLGAGVVTQDKLAAKSVGTGAITITSTSTTSATVASDFATLTGTLGRPVVVGLKNTNFGGGIIVSSSTNAFPQAEIQIWRDGSQLSSIPIGIRKNSGEANFSIVIPPTSIQHVDIAPGATGTRNYFIKVLVNSSDVTLQLPSTAMVYAYEL